MAHVDREACRNPDTTTGNATMSGGCPAVHAPASLEKTNIFTKSDLAADRLRSRMGFAESPEEPLGIGMTLRFALIRLGSSPPAEWLPCRYGAAQPIAALGWMLLALCPRTTWADSDWEPRFYSLRDWAPVQTWDYVALPAGLTATLAANLTASPATRWEGGILFDDWARNGLRLNSDAARSHASDVSTVLLVANGIAPLLLDAGLLTAVVHRRSDLAWQMAILDAEALTLTGLLTETTKRLAGRARPSGPGENDSFFSGHSSIASAGATLICLQHLELELLGNKAADAAVCGAAGVAAISTGLLRIMSDRHYASDVMVGTAVGIGSTFLVYKLKVRPMPAERSALQITPLLHPEFLGLSLAGAF